MRLHAPGESLRSDEMPVASPAHGEILLKVRACGVCRTDLHIIDGELTGARMPVVPGHEIVGVVMEAGLGVDRFSRGDRVGVPWLGRSCGQCVYCRAGRENLCDEARFTGFHRDGGYAEYALVDARR
jgi:propanol-preferring alcohol dehydrogenase